MGAWPAHLQASALDAYAAATGHAVFTGVPLTAPGWREWGSRTRRRVEPVALRLPEPAGCVTAYDESSFSRALASAVTVHPVVAWGYVDRPSFGHLTTRQQFLARSWQPAAPVQPVALVAAGRRRSNVAAVFFGAGFDIFELPGEPAARRGAGAGGGGAGGRNDPWHQPTTAEDRMLHALWRRRGGRDWWLAEVPVGFDGQLTDRRARRIDAVVVETDTPRTSAGGKDLDELQSALSVRAEVIEAKNHPLRTDVIGQALCGRLQLAASYPQLGELSATVCVTDADDDAMRWFCARNGIRVEVTAPA